MVLPRGRDVTPVTIPPAPAARPITQTTTQTMEGVPAVQPHGTSTAVSGPGSQALEALRRTWGGAYSISRTEGGRRAAVSRDRERRASAGDAPGDLEHELRVDFAFEGTR